jgi:hypothetical protein
VYIYINIGKLYFNRFRFKMEFSFCRSRLRGFRNLQCYEQLNNKSATRLIVRRDLHSANRKILRTKKIYTIFVQSQQGIFEIYLYCLEDSYFPVESKDAFFKLNGEQFTLTSMLYAPCITYCMRNNVCDFAMFIYFNFTV